MDMELLQSRLDAFQPEPLIADVTIPTNQPIEIHQITETGPVYDLAKVNYLNVLDNEDIKRVAERTIRQYGVGTCGPRAFYGTTDVHLHLEEKLANFLQMEQAISYSFGFVAISSTVAAYCKKHDIVYVDEKTNFAIEQGLVAARSTVKRFKHNNPNSFLELIQMERSPKKRHRQFLIIEAISWSTGALCHLPEFLRIAEEYKIRIFVDESYSLGVYGRTGRGITEHFGIDTTRIDMILGTMEGAIGSIGGFSAGSDRLLDHQCLSSSGYIFSASLPTYLVQTVIDSLDICERDAHAFHTLTTEFHRFLIGLRLKVISDAGAPFKVIQFESMSQKECFDGFCRQRHVYMINNNNVDEMTLVMHLNLALLQDQNRLDALKAIFTDAITLIY